MRKILVGLVATAAIATPLVAATAANAATPSGSTCTPSKAVTAVSHTEYKWAALVTKGGLHWEYKWTATLNNPSTDLAHVWVKSLDLTKRGQPQITRIVVDTPAKDAVTCAVTLPEHFEGEGTYSVVVPYVVGVDTFLLGVQGYDEKVAITQDVTVTKAMAGQFWIGHQAQDGYLIANPSTAQWHIDFQFASDGITAEDHRTAVALTDSTGQPLQGGVVWTVAPDGTWTEIGTTDSNGAVSAELVPGSTYEFVMVYGGARQSKSVAIDADGTSVDFKTASATVNFKNSKDQPRADGVVWTVAPDGTWTEIGTTDSNGAVSAELLPGSTYEFVMVYGGARQSKSVAVDADGTSVDFKTASATVNFKNSKGEFSAGGVVWAAAPDGTWTEIGTTDSNGAVSAELLPGSTYEFVMVYGGARQSKTVAIDAAGTSVDFNTYRVEVRGQVTNAGTTSSVKTGTWWYIAPDGGWHDLGMPDAQGDAITQLLPGTYTFVHVAEDGIRHEFKDVKVEFSGRKVLKFVG